MIPQGGLTKAANQPNYSLAADNKGGSGSGFSSGDTQDHVIQQHQTDWERGVLQKSIEEMNRQQEAQISALKAKLAKVCSL